MQDFGDYLNLIYPNELEIKDTTDTPMSASYLDLHLDKRGDFNFQAKCNECLSDELILRYI